MKADSQNALKKIVKKRIHSILHNFTKEELKSFNTIPSSIKDKDVGVKKNVKIINNNPINKYLANFYTVKKILKRCKEKKYQEMVKIPLEPSLLKELFSSIPPKNQTMLNNYYTLDRNAKSPDYYFTLNSDVVSFAKNYDKVFRIRMNEFKTAYSNKIIPQSKSTKSRRNHSQFLPRVHNKNFSTFIEEKFKGLHKFNRRFKNRNPLHKTTTRIKLPLSGLFK